jgi:hypothetical protein
MLMGIRLMPITADLSTFGGCSNIQVNKLKSIYVRPPSGVLHVPLVPTAFRFPPRSVPDSVCDPSWSLLSRIH